MNGPQCNAPGCSLESNVTVNLCPMHHHQALIRIDPDQRLPSQMSAREWRDAYFALSRIALKELEECRAALASDAGSVGALDVERLARALRTVGPQGTRTTIKERAAAIAAAYEGEK